MPIVCTSTRSGIDDGRTIALMVTSGDQDPIEAIHLLTALARKQILVLMVAINDQDDDLTLIAATRVRDALRAAQRTVSSLADPSIRSAALAMLEATKHTAAPWLVRVPRLAEPIIQFPTLPSLKASDWRDPVADLDLNGAKLGEVDMSGLSLSGLRAHGATFAAANATGARLSWCEFFAGSLGGARFDRSTIENCAFDRSNLERSSWASARVTRSTFEGAVLVDARLDGTVLTDCDLRGVDLRIVNSTLHDAPVRTMFVRCDLRCSNWDRRSLAGVHFFECKLYGVHGTPLDTRGLEIVRPDLSYAADRSRIGMEADVRLLWGIEDDPAVTA